MEFYSVTQKSEIMLFAGKWIELENNMLSEVSQAQKVKKPNVSPHVEARPIS
jgi:predicted XRE-type DNA-binding protein